MIIRLIEKYKMCKELKVESSMMAAHLKAYAKYRFIGYIYCIAVSPILIPVIAIYIMGYLLKALGEFIIKIDIPEKLKLDFNKNASPVKETARAITLKYGFAKRR